MSDYSKEYYELNGIGLEGDFSIIREFIKLNNGESSDEICEGFGITEILNIDGECWVKVRKEIIRFKDFIEKQA